MKRKRRQSKGTVQNIGFSWYLPQDYGRIREISEDGDKLHDTFEEWEESALEAVKMAQKYGHRVTKVLVKPEELLQWCKLKGVPVNASSRAEYVGRSITKNVTVHL